MHDDPANDNAATDRIDAWLLLRIFDLLDHAREQGYVPSALFDELSALAPHVSPGEIRAAMQAALQSGYVCRRGRCIYLERRMTPEQLAFLRRVIGQMVEKRA